MFQSPHRPFVFRVTELESRFTPSATYSAPAAPSTDALAVGETAPVQIGTNDAGEAIYAFEAAPGRCGCAMCGGRVAMALAPAIAEPAPAPVAEPPPVVEAARALAVPASVPATQTRSATPAPTAVPPTVAFPAPAAPTTVPTPAADVEPVLAEPFAVFAATDFESAEQPDRVVTDSAVATEVAITLFDSPFEFGSPLAG